MKNNKNYNLSYDIFYDLVGDYKEKKFYKQGSNPRLLKKLFQRIDERISEVNSIRCALFLFNNPILLDKLKQYALKGIKIEIVSIPLDGYDEHYPMPIIDFESGQEEGSFTKYDLAKRVYEDARAFSENCKNFQFYIFSHIYIRSPKFKKFSRGTYPYSLHTKSFVINYKDGSGITGLTSSNLATRDEIKDNLIFFLQDINSVKVANYFFDGLISNIKSNSANSESSTADGLHYSIAFKLTPQKLKKPIKSRTYFISPFFEDSPNFINEFLCEKISEAQHQLYFSAEHITAFDFKGIGNSGRLPGIVGKAFEAAERGVPVHFLSQTFYESTTETPGDVQIRTIKNTTALRAVKEKIDELKSPNIYYTVNNNNHCKFIVIDDWAIITTCNFTPTQFLYDKNVVIPGSYKNSNVLYKGVFSEVGQYFAIKDNLLCEKLIELFKKIESEDGVQHMYPKPF